MTSHQFREKPAQGPSNSSQQQNGLSLAAMPAQTSLTAQLEAMPEEEMPLQGKFITQLQTEDEEPLQGKFEPVQKKANNTGLPDKLKTGVEQMSGFSMDDVRVHYNSTQPATLQAHAYAQGTDIHVGPGQERHVPHEAWHVVQQKQGRVQPTTQLKESVPVNDDAGLETEADVMGGKAML